MISAPSSMSVGIPVATTSNGCDSAPPTLFAATPNPVQSPIQSPIQVGMVATVGGSSVGAPAPAVTTSSPVMAASAGVGALGTMPSVAPSTPAFSTPVTVTPAPSSGAAAAPTRMTSLAPGGTASDANLVEGALATLRSSASGAQVVDRLLAVGAKVNVINDNEFAALGHKEAHAFFDPANDTIYLRRSELQGPDRRFSAVALAHEGTHLLDDVAGVADPFVARKAQAIAAAGGLATPVGAEAQKQAIFELTMIKEARAFTFAGQVAKELAVTTPANDATSISAAGANDQATYGRVWNALLTSAYNPEKRTAAVANF